MAGALRRVLVDYISDSNPQEMIKSLEGTKLRLSALMPCIMKRYFALFELYVETLNLDEASLTTPQDGEVYPLWYALNTGDFSVVKYLFNKYHLKATDTIYHPDTKAQISILELAKKGMTSGYKIVDKDIRLVPRPADPADNLSPKLALLPPEPDPERTQRLQNGARACYQWIVAKAMVEEYRRKNAKDVPLSEYSARASVAPPSAVASSSAVEQQLEVRGLDFD